MALKIPDLFSHTSAYTFIYEFLELNAKEPGFSQRSLAAKLGWPISYVPDLMKRRKSFTVKRAVEFGNYFKLGPIDIEKLIYLALSDSGLVKDGDIQRISAVKKIERQYDTTNFELLNVATFIVFETIRWLHGNATLEILTEVGAQKKFAPEVIAESISILLRIKAIEKHGEKFSIITDDLFADDRGTDVAALNMGVNEQFTVLLGKYFANAPFGPALLNSSIVLIDKDRFAEIADRAVAFRNWIFEISKADAKLPLEKDVRLFQFDLNFTPLLNAETTQQIRSRATENRERE